MVNITWVNRVTNGVHTIDQGVLMLSQPKSFGPAAVSPPPRTELSRRGLLRLGAGLGLGVGSGLLLAGCGVEESSAGTGFPERSLEWVVPASPGGSNDLIARMLAKQLGTPLGQPVVVINREGAAGAVGTREVIAAKPDGYKLIIAPSSLFAITPLVQKGMDIPLDTMRIIMGLTVENTVLIVHKDSKYQTIDDLMADKGAKLKFAHSGVGTGIYLAQTLFYQQAGLDAVDVPFGGSGPAITALLGKQVDIAASNVAESKKQVASGDLRRLAIFSAERSTLLPDLPTIKEKGIDVVVDQSRFVAAPAKVPDQVAKVLEGAFKEAVKTAEYDTFLKDNFIERRELSGPDIIARMKADKDKYKAQMDTLGITAK